MQRREILCFLWITLAAGVNVLTSAEADPVVLPTPEFPHFRQISPTDPRPRLSISQQAQILSDVQQHQPHYWRPDDDPSPNAAYSSLAKYKVDRAKQQLQQQLLQQQQHVQQLLQQQRQKIAQQLDQSLFQRSQLPKQQQQQQRIQQNFQQQQQQQQHYDNRHSNLASEYQNAHQETTQPLFGDQHNLQLHDYLDKQRELEALLKQRQQLLLEQQELKRQQELLRLEQLRQLTSTTTTTTPVTTSTVANTTPTSLLFTSQTARKITPSEADLFLKAIASHQKKYSTTTVIPPSTLATVTATSIVGPTKTPRQSLAKSSSDKVETSTVATVHPTEQQEGLVIRQGENKPQIRIIYQTDKPTTQRQSDLTVDNELLLKQLQLALAENVEEDFKVDSKKNITTRDLVLPNGKKVQVIQAPNATPSIPVAVTSTSTIKPAKAVFEELTKGVLPPGADFEIIRQKSDGKLEEIGKTPIQNLPGKKVTFVVLEEQPDGSYKVQGVKGNTDKEGGDVQSIVEKIKKGELKLPSSSNDSTKQHPSISTITTFRPTTTTTAAATTISPGRTVFVSTPSSSRTSEGSLSDRFPYVSSASNINSHTFTAAPSTTATVTAGLASKYSTTPLRNHFAPTVTVTYDQTSSLNYSPSTKLATSTAASPASRHNDYVLYQENSEKTAVHSAEKHESLTTLLRKEGLFAIAKYLRQSGLDSVLNETGPYTIFVPTDKAFRTLLVQLGGPEKAEEKFRDNPRLLSGLLLHHVIPGAFRIESLQDEMSGVSLAGTQLRVNEYAMHDHEWNDVKVITINGAKVAPNKRNIEIPQGIAHAVDRVMFPLPVGDLLQTLQADRERRFTIFLKMLHASGLDNTLSGTKTFTVFAPTDEAFIAAASKNGSPVWTEDDGPVAAKTVVSKHIVPTTLYTAGMRYYLQKDTLRPQSPIHIHKNGARIKVNEVNVVTHNVPATNGVLHAIDGVL